MFLSAQSTISYKSKYGRSCGLTNIFIIYFFTIISAAIFRTVLNNGSFFITVFWVVVAPPPFRYGCGPPLSKSIQNLGIVETLSCRLLLKFLEEADF